jgi:SAM-dependent methyltransferase
MPASSAPPVPADQLLLQLATGKWASKAVGVVADLGIADLLGNGSRSSDELAADARVNPDALYRLLRTVASLGVLTELPDRRFKNNDASLLLRSDTPGSLRAMVRMVAMDSTWRAWGSLGYSVETGRPAFDHVHGAQLFEYFHGHPESAQIFHDAMVSFTTVTGPAVADAYDFSSCRTIVDVGGGHGALLAAIAKKHPGIHGIVFERPEVIDAARSFLDAQGLNQIETAGGDFFGPLPGGADTYLMKHIIHDWDDERSIQILANCRKAMAPGGKALIVEQVVTDRPDAVMSKLADLEMLVMTPGGRERTGEEFARLLAAAGLRLTRIVPTDYLVCIVEAVSG